MRENAWIEWKGGECPVDDGQEIEVRFRYGAEAYIGDRATTFDWSHEPADPEQDIIAYRLSGPSA